MQNSRYEAINTYLNKGTIEAYLADAKEKQLPFCIAKFGFEVDLEDGFFFKNLIFFMQTHLEFLPIIHHGNDTFLILFRNVKLHDAKKRLKNLEHIIKIEFKREIKSIGLTLFDPQESYKTLFERLEKYYVLSKLSRRKKIFFGTADFDLYETINPNLLLGAIFKRENKITLNNLYNGIPIQEEAVVAKFEEGVIQLKVASPKISFYINESFTFLQHDKIPHILKAKIIKVDPIKSLLVLNHIELLEHSALDRLDIRIAPTKTIHATLSHQKIKCCDGIISNLSESSLVLHVKINDIEKIVQKGWSEHAFEIAFQLPTTKGFLTPISAKVTIFNIVNESIVLSLQPNVFMKSKLRHYIALQQNTLLLQLKQELKHLI
ncbi:hypothetical protein [Sulfurospirillum deleyianum]|uniref:Type IV pilus assembly PilZ n=1 Tax=Sulfurospirillum deleyianum (strain ATCC 51133 / DSM 6946 / 5175) TaxID=525898 RepID=D1B444_SULD5|nr:hypothetical protein [Sulfurospirillum deleyianum]ACZ12864.1 hypothetical protein Sdel_1849 [Sulfurospirillum deleyianum DSM 6946]